MKPLLASIQLASVVRRTVRYLYVCVVISIAAVHAGGGVWQV